MKMSGSGAKSQHAQSIATTALSSSAHNHTGVDRGCRRRPSLNRPATPQYRLTLRLSAELRSTAERLLSISLPPQLARRLESLDRELISVYQS